MIIYCWDIHWRPHKVTPSPITGLIHQAAESHQYFDSVEWEFRSIQVGTANWARVCWYQGQRRNCLFQQFLTVSPASTDSIQRMSTLGRCVGQLSCDWPVFCVISLLQFLCVSTRYFLTFCTTVASAISPHLLYIMIVDFIDRMTTAILRKNYHTVRQHDMNGSRYRDPKTYCLLTILQVAQSWVRSSSQRCTRWRSQEGWQNKNDLILFPHSDDYLEER